MDMNDEEFKKLKKEISVKHGYNLDDDDPILMFVTLNEYMLKQYKEALDYNLQDLSDIMINIKGDVNQYIKENELNLFKRIQEINNSNVSKVHNKIKDYFQQEAKSINIIHQKNNKKYNILTMLAVLNTCCIFVILLFLIYNKYV